MAEKTFRPMLTYADEAHHSSAASYKRIMDYFIPRLWLGMTATPDKRDDNLEGRNIYEIFNHQIAYEIRLQNAMEEDLICPFHYFGIDYFYRIPNCIHRIFNFRFRYTRNSRRCSRVFTTRKSKFPTEKIYIH